MPPDLVIDVFDLNLAPTMPPALLRRLHDLLVVLPLSFSCHPARTRLAVLAVPVLTLRVSLAIVAALRILPLSILALGSRLADVLGAVLAPHIRGVFDRGHPFARPFESPPPR